MNNPKYDTDFLKAISICLIINSHLGCFYPISHLGTGGMIGNSFFFMLSAFGLYLSQCSREITSFNSWYARRILRIFPSSWVVVLMIVFPISVYFGTLRWENLLAQLGMLFYPPFWFLKALLIYYVLIFVMIRRISERMIIIIAIVLAVLYVIIYSFCLDLRIFVIETPPFDLIFYFMTVLLGLYMGMNEKRIRYSGKMDVAGLIICVGIIYFHKYLMVRGFLEWLQCIQHFAVFPLLYFSLKIVRSNHIISVMAGDSAGSKTVKFLSSMTLELFMVNNSIVIAFCKIDLTFPLNAILFVGVTIILSVMVKKFAEYIRRKMEGRIISDRTYFAG